MKLHDIATTFMLPMEILCVSCARVMADVITYPLQHFFQGGHKLDGVWHSGLRVFGKEFWSCPELFLDGE